MAYIGLGMVVNEGKLVNVILNSIVRHNIELLLTYGMKFLSVCSIKTVGKLKVM